MDRVTDGGLTVGGSWTSNQANTWDKASDINVQALGNAIPEPASYALTGIAMLALGAARRRRA
ncbi:PEP-CTERM sorting domain-containing protein [Paucibacter sp. B2R-40]|uniref:PEP-CTERM sorting domain-containing protein n=1 Tax=Paucibacter sp. B2R-40 TaxID=2893554 RepID=UPI0021E4546A|nr:PEP-CTERM sorting domain-containing protein [Paucibacter sp. B2R-40]MCV2355975.1 PEP-CTERM sorting domain-containing protein [Paucibacter sp. B2R-40]